MADDDVLKKFSVQQVHGWYERLAKKVEAKAKSQGVAVPMSGTFLLHYLGRNNNNKLGDVLQIDAPEHLRNDDSVTDVLEFHRAVFLTQKKGQFNPEPERWAGLVPRFQNGKWDGNSDIGLEYTCLSDVAPSNIAIAKLYVTKPPKKWDIFTSLRGWQLKSTARIKGTKAQDGSVSVAFSGWNASGEDFYDFNKSEHLTLPNPDYLSSEKWAIAPNLEEITVYHTNAFRLEAAGLAKTYKVIVRPWIVRDPKLLAPAKLDTKKSL